MIPSGSGWHWRRVRLFLEKGLSKGTASPADPQAARELIVSVIKRL